MTLTIVSGVPGAGKTTAASRLAAHFQHGLHIPTDLFYSFPSHPIDPTLPEAHAQNEAIIRATGACAAAFLRSGCEVFLDGIVGPWFLPDLLAEIPEAFQVAYVLLTVDEAVGLERVRAREGPGMSSRVLATRGAFARSDEFVRHEFDTTGLDPESVCRLLREKLAAGAYDLARGGPEPVRG